MSTDNDTNESVTVSTVDLSPAAAEEFTRIMEVLGDRSDLIWQPETQKRLMDFYTTIAAEDILDEWKKPTPLHSNEDLPSFPVEGLPPVIRDQVIGLAEEIQVPVDLVSVMALAALSASLVGRVKVNVDGNWDERVTLYALGLAETGNRKSSLRGPLFNPLLTAQKQLEEITAEARLKATQDKYAAEMAAKAADKRASKDTATLEDFAAAATAKTAAEALEVPSKPALFTTDATPEALLIRMKYNGGRQAVFDAEGDGLIVMAGVKYGNGNSSNIGMLLKSHVGDPISQTRVGRDDIELECPILAIGVLTQMETLRELVNVPNSTGRGLVDRFLIAAPPDKLGYRQVSTTPVSSGVSEAYSALLVSYAVSLWGAEDQTLILTDEAKAVLLAYRQSSEDRLKPGEDLRALGGFGSKLAGSAVRLAALHHLAHYGVMAAFHSKVNEVSMQWGVQVAEWSLVHYRYAYTVASETSSVPNAEKVLLWLRGRDTKSEVISKRDVVWGTNLKASQVEEALGLLAEHNYVRQAREIRKFGPGRKQQNWEVNPALI